MKNVQGGFNPILNVWGEGGHLKSCKIESVNRLKQKAYALTRCHLTRPGHGDGPIAKDRTVVTPTLVQLYAQCSWCCSGVHPNSCQTKPRGENVRTKPPRSAQNNCHSTATQLPPNCRSTASQLPLLFMEQITCPLEGVKNY